MKRHNAALAVASLAWLALAGCALGVQDSAAGEGRAESERVELPKPQPFPPVLAGRARRPRCG